jgi:hypothetical protein
MASTEISAGHELIDLTDKMPDWDIEPLSHERAAEGTRTNLGAAPPPIPASALKPSRQWLAALEALAAEPAPRLPPRAVRERAVLPPPRRAPTAQVEIAKPAPPPIPAAALRPATQPPPVPALRPATQPPPIPQPATTMLVVAPEPALPAIEPALPVWPVVPPPEPTPSFEVDLTEPSALHELPTHEASSTSYFERPAPRIPRSVLAGAIAAGVVATIGAIAYLATGSATKPAPAAIATPAPAPTLPAPPPLAPAPVETPSASIGSAVFELSNNLQPPAATPAPAPVHRAPAAPHPAPAPAAPHAAPPARVAVAAPAPARAAAPAAGTGILMISTKPPCTIIVDGKPTKFTTPQKSLPLPAGHHQLTLVNAQQKVKASVDVTIDAHHPTKVIKDFTSGSHP